MPSPSGPRPILVALAVSALAARVTAQQEPDDVQRADTVVVEGRADSMIGIADSAGQGVIGRDELRTRPILRPADILETVPGVVITQHSGSGKANQFFLRGFNLDHGTDLLTRVGGIPINLPSHGHGQGYTDLNFLIPELVDTIAYRKGPYNARDGDFSSAGAIDIEYVDTLARGVARLEGGSFDFVRGMFGQSVELGSGELLIGAEVQHTDGPWTNPENHTRFNGVLRYSAGGESERFRLTFMGYDAEWNATHQIPQRAVDAATIGRFDAIDPTDGGRTERYSLAGDWVSRDDSGETRALLYGVYYDFDLFSNFTYFLDDPVNGDQFEQQDERVYLGLDTSRTWFGSALGADMENALGVQVRSDLIDNGLFRTQARQRLSTTRTDEIRQTSVGLYGENRTSWTDWFRTTIGLRGDLYHFDVDSDNPANSGSDSDGIFSPKLSMVFGPWSDTELYASAGYGFHSNDARGVLTRDDPATPAPGDGDPVSPLVRSRGIDVGVRTSALEGLQSTLTAFYLHSDSELVFVGDAGTTEPSGASERFGFEFANFYQPVDEFTLDFDLTWAHARFIDGNPGGDRIPNAIETVIAAGATYQQDDWLAALRVRHFGTYPLVEDNSVRAAASTLVSARVEYRFTESTSIGLDVFNLFDTGANDIEYFYGSRLPGEPAGGVDDVHFHPAQPFALRLALTATF